MPRVSRLRSALSNLSELVPRADFQDYCPPALDTSVPVFIVRLGAYPLHHGCVGLIRSLGRVGISVEANAEDRFTPAAVSRYLKKVIVWQPSDLDDREQLVQAIIRIASRPGLRPLLIPTDDQGAVLVAEESATLREYFVLPDVPPTLPRELSSKRGLYEACLRHGTPTPRTYFPSTSNDVRGIIEQLAFPVIVKAVAPFATNVRSNLRTTERVDTVADLEQMAALWHEPYEVIIQEYLPNEYCEDWVVQGYRGANSDRSIYFSGRKLRTSPAFAHSIALAEVAKNAELEMVAKAFFERVDYRGIFDSDWRLDTRTNRFHLVDFNPRIGAAFRLFESTDGVDVARAMHLDLSGRSFGKHPATDGDRYVVENSAISASFSDAWSPTPLRIERDRGPRARPRGAWWFTSDPLPMIAMVARQCLWLIRKAAVPNRNSSV